jgi:hypothetical protein
MQTKGRIADGDREPLSIVFLLASPSFLLCRLFFYRLSSFCISMTSPVNTFKNNLFGQLKSYGDAVQGAFEQRIGKYTMRSIMLNTYNKRRHFSSYRARVTRFSREIRMSY